MLQRAVKGNEQIIVNDQPNIYENIQDPDTGISKNLEYHQYSNTPEKHQ